MDCVCCVCIVCCERDMYIHDVYILMNWEGTLHKEALRRQATDGIGESQLSEPPKGPYGVQLGDWMHPNAPMG